MFVFRPIAADVLSPAPTQSRTGVAWSAAWGRAGLVALFALVLALRMPGVLHGRLWAEDGLFLLDALRLPWWQALVAPHTGYIDMVASTIMLIATRTALLEYAPLVSVALSLAVQCLPAMLLATSRIAWLDKPAHLAVALAMLAFVPLSEEVWLSPITLQYHLIVCVGIVLADQPRRGWVGWLQNAVLLAGPLAGPGPSLIGPLFFCRASIDRTGARWLQAALISAGTLVQLAVLATHPEPHRAIGVMPDLLLLVVWVKHVLVPLFGRAEAIDLAQGIAPAYVGSIGSDFTQLWIAGFGAAAALLAMGVAVWRSPHREVRWLYAAGLLAMVLSYVGALGGKADLIGVMFGQRYAVAPQMLFGLALVGLATGRPSSGSGGVGRSVAMGLVAWLLVVGAHEYTWVEPRMAHGPSWRAQVLAWRAEPAGPILLWPPSFRIVLPPDR